MYKHARKHKVRPTSLFAVNAKPRYKHKCQMPKRKTLAIVWKKAFGAWSVSAKEQEHLFTTLHFMRIVFLGQFARCMRKELKLKSSQLLVVGHLSLSPLFLTFYLSTRVKFRVTTSRAHSRTSYNIHHTNSCSYTNIYCDIWWNRSAAVDWCIDRRPVVIKKGNVC